MSDIYGKTFRWVTFTRVLRVLPVKSIDHDQIKVNVID